MNDEEAIDALVRIKKCADNEIKLILNQGQALDGYSELANYRQIIEKYIKAHE